ncbi:replication-associated recombination protein A [Desulfonatronospira sp.]|uniref:replication-associated recombination protein A n=1 Tax=Desulfonatronospira sp. TaxID=1962951 RepID=UPI0025C1FD4B|nr:replication-associated recombination protein A [Desulfonatronospira sp.]
MQRPLAEKIRPRSIEDFVGQSHLRTRLRAMGQSQRLQSTLFFGPPGCGKSTLALIIAQSQGKQYLRLSAPETGLAELRKKLEGLEILILDELHRFSKAQQDFFLPLLETGEIILLATTTENPSFSVTRQLLSRMNVLRLRSMSMPELRQIGERAAKELDISIPDKSLDLLASLSGGDARTFLNLMEYVNELDQEDLEPERLKSVLPEAVIKGDRDGDMHYELASAMIKSIRGSDPDAALYYLACLLEAGEDPRFVCRRLILSASEDVGLADPMALPMAVSCQHAVEFVGMPEGFIPLAEAAVYLALAPKSNSTYSAYLSAQKEIRHNGPRPVPLHLRNASTTLQKEWGYGQGYKYPHLYPGAWIEQEYLPSELAGRRFYEPKDQGQEPRLLAWLRKRKKI